MINLLVFAHKAEASVFIRELHFKRDNSFSGDLYQTQELCLLICGEGPMRASSKLSKAIHHLGPDKIQQVINLGVAGSLSDKLNLEQIYDFSVVLGEASYGKPEFKSFETKNIHSKNYLITALDRVKTTDYSEQLSTFAEAVDREAWGLAYVCDEYKLSFLCYKLISDKAGPETQCFDVREKAKFYSEKIFEFYLQNFSKVNLENKSKNQKLVVDNELLDKHFFFSATQKKNFEKLCLSLKKMDSKLFLEILEKENLEQICAEFNRPKDRTKALLEEMQNNLNPFQKGFSAKLKEWFSARPKAVKQVQTDPFYEKEDLKILLEIKNQKDLIDAQNYLAQLPLKKYHELFDGLSKDQDV